MNESAPSAAAGPGQEPDGAHHQHQPLDQFHDRPEDHHSMHFIDFLLGVIIGLLWAILKTLERKF